MRTFLYPLLILILASCSPKAQTQTGLIKLDTTTIKEKIINENLFITQCDTLDKRDFIISRKRKDLFVFKEMTFLYCSPSLNNEVIDTLYLNEKTRSWREFSLTTTAYWSKPDWYEVYFKNKKGYLFSNDLANLRLRASNVLVKENPEGVGGVLLKSVDSTHQLIDTIRLRKSHGYGIHPLTNNGLNFSKNVLKYRTYRESCPGTSSIS